MSSESRRYDAQSHVGWNGFDEQCLQDIDALRKTQNKLETLLCSDSQGYEHPGEATSLVIVVMPTLIRFALRTEF